MIKHCLKCINVNAKSLFCRKNVVLAQWAEKMKNLRSKLIPNLLFWGPEVVHIWHNHLGKDPATKSDDFLEKIPNSFWPPNLIFGKLYCNFF